MEISLRRPLYSLILSVALLTIALAHPARAENPPEFAWIREFGSPADDSVFAMTSDGTGLYLVGHSKGALPGQNHAGGSDGFVRKYDFGGSEVWTQQPGTAADDWVGSVAANGSAVYVSGGTGGSLPGQTSSGGYDAFLRKYSPGGGEVWTIQFGTAVGDWANGVALHSTGLYVAGLTHGAFPGQSFAGAQDSFLQKYDFDGNHLWTRQFGTVSYDSLTAAFADDTGVYVTGWVQQALPGQTWAGDYDVYVRKYDHAGVEQWTDQFGTPFSDMPQGGIVADSTGIYVFGETPRALPGQTHLGSIDAFLRKYDRAGTVLWTVQFGTSLYDSGSGSYADDSGVYVTGYTYGSFPGYSNAGTTGDVYLRKYDSFGIEVWTRQFGTAGLDGGSAVELAAGDVFVSGFVNGALPTQTAIGQVDVFAMRLGGTPGVDASPGILSFGGVEMGTTAFANLTIRSVGTAFLEVTTISLVSGNRGFGIADAAPTPFYLPQQETVNIMISFAPSFAGAAADTLWIATNDPIRGPIEVSLSGSGIPVPRIEVAPEAMALGSVELGTTMTRDVTIRSTGSGSLQVASASLLAGGSGFSVDGSPVVPFSVLPGATATLRVLFAPNAVGPSSSTLRIASNDASRSSVDIPLSGEGFVVSDLEVNSAALDLGTVDLGTTAARTLAISSVRSGDVTVTGISLASGTGGFEILEAPPTPFVIRAGLSSDVQITFAPSVIGPASDALSILSDDPDEGLLTIPLSGRGVDTAPPSLAHVPPGAVAVGQGILVRVTVTDLGGVESVNLHYRNSGETDFHILTMVRTGDSYQADIPAQATAVDILYYFVARDTTGNEAREPREVFHTVRVNAESVQGTGETLPTLAVVLSIVLVVAVVLSIGFLIRYRRRPKKLGP